MRIQAFIVDAAGTVLQRMKVPTVEALQQQPLEPGQEIVTYTGVLDIENLQPVKDAQNVYTFIPRVVPAANLLMQAKVVKRAEINDKREQLRNGSCITPKGAVDCDPESRALMMSTIVTIRERIIANLPVTGKTWTMADNTDVFHTPAELRTMFMTVDQFLDAVQAKARELKIALFQANTVAEVNAIDVQGAAWPT